MSEQANEIYDTFTQYASNLLNSSHTAFFAHLNTFKDFCNNTSEINEILKQVIQCPYDGLKYFTSKQENNYSVVEPKDNLEMLKLAYDSLWSNINILQIHTFAMFGLRSGINKFDYSLQLFNSQVTTPLLMYIDINLKKYKKDVNIPTQVINYQIEEIHDSIVGNQTNASITNNTNDNKPKSRFEIFAEKHKHKIAIILTVLGIIVAIIIAICQTPSTP